MSTKQPELMSSDELAVLMDQVQELLETNVLAMITRDARGRITLQVPPQRRTEVVAILASFDWTLLA